VGWLWLGCGLLLLGLGYAPVDSQAQLILSYVLLAVIEKHIAKPG